uniref:Uncharacterized protein n=1 Tax=Octopus bimaculoides TaxID=37653 RepID=A0A0L8H137_OCTBM
MATIKTCITKEDPSILVTSAFTTQPYFGAKLKANKMLLSVLISPVVTLVFTISHIFTPAFKHECSVVHGIGLLDGFVSYSDLKARNSFHLF